jgi:HSP20 family protein
MQNEMNRLFNTFFDSPTPSNGGNAAVRRWIPAMDVVETEDHFVLRADLPGLAENDVKIEVEDNVLTIAGERKSEHEQRSEGYYRVERAFGSFSRSLTLPEGVNADAVQASFGNGVLEVRIPKPEQHKPRKVQISLGGQAKTIEGSETTEPTAAA